MFTYLLEYILLEYILSIGYILNNLNISMRKVEYLIFNMKIIWFADMVRFALRARRNNYQVGAIKISLHDDPITPFLIYISHRPGVR